jgi:hypothetical protein
MNEDLNPGQTIQNLYESRNTPEEKPPGPPISRLARKRRERPDNKIRFATKYASL